MGRKTKAQRNKAVKRTATANPDSTKAVNAAKAVSKMPRTANVGVRHRPVAHKNGTEARKQAASSIAKSFKAITNNAASSEVREQASRRMKAVLDMLNVKPAPILEQLKQIGVPFTIVQNVRGEPKYDTVVMKVSDLEAADREIAAKGTLYSQIYNESGEVRP